MQYIDPKKHINKDGARYHVLWYGLKYQNGKLVGFRRCSERQCEVNKVNGY